MSFFVFEKNKEGGEGHHSRCGVGIQEQCNEELEKLSRRRQGQMSGTKRQLAQVRFQRDKHLDRLKARTFRNLSYARSTYISFCRSFPPYVRISFFFLHLFLFLCISHLSLLIRFLHTLYVFPSLYINPFSSFFCLYFFHLSAFFLHLLCLFVFLSVIPLHTFYHFFFFLLFFNSLTNVYHPSFLFSCLSINTYFFVSNCIFTKFALSKIVCSSL